MGTPSTNYRLSIGGYQSWGRGAAGDSMTRRGNANLNGMQLTTRDSGIPFSTHDRDNDRAPGKYNCAADWNGAWW